MNKFKLLASTFLLGLAAATDHWAIIVSGSNGYWNYRHQADACHAYQIMKKNGIPEEQIILFAFDDIATSQENPFPGKLYNKPDGPDVYEGCKIDYSSYDVNPQNFLLVLKGDYEAMKNTGTGKVLQTNEKSKIFVFFTDHGAPGLVAFPSEYLYAKDLIETIEIMNEKKLYSEMVLYIEACESGSMFEGLLKDNLNVYAVTASNAVESSWGTYCYPDDTVGGVHVNSCLGDLFSVNWMEDADESNPKRETLDQQFERVKELTTLSHVMRYGSMDFVDEVTGNFIGNYDIKESDQNQHFFDALISRAKFLSSSQYDVDFSAVNERRLRSSINSRNAKLNHLYAKISENGPGSFKAQLDLSMELNRRMRVDHVFEEYKTIRGVTQDTSYLPRNFECLATLIETYDNTCGKMDEYDFQYIQLFVNDCETLPEISSIQPSINAIKTACNH